MKKNNADVLATVRFAILDTFISNYHKLHPRSSLVMEDMQMFTEEILKRLQDDGTSWAFFHWVENDFPTD